jgi:hypothetical protein
MNLDHILGLRSLKSLKRAVCSNDLYVDKYG